MISVDLQPGGAAALVLLLGVLVFGAVQAASVSLDDGWQFYRGTWRSPC